jgi:L-alanine-DL-glutamate epimerase-like enolase superfamily enzyme
MTITSLHATPIRIPLRTPAAFSNRQLLHRDYVLVHMTSADGHTGMGYAYAGTSGGTWLAQAVDGLIAPLLVGRDAGAIQENWQRVYQELLLLGRAGGLLRALSAVDIAAWDLLGRRTGTSLARLLGGAPDRVPAYASGGYYRDGDPIEHVVGEIERYAALGFRDFKIKVGGMPGAGDVARVAAAREAIGTEGRLALDANNAWRSADEALRAIAAFEPYDIWWIEEPLSPDDLHGHAAIARASPITVATGEIEATRWAFADLIRADSCAILQPDAGVLGGVTEFVKVAAAADAFGRVVAPHWHANLHAQLAAATNNCIAIEYFALGEDIYNFEAIVADPLEVVDGEVVVPDRPGLGFSLDEDAVAALRLDAVAGEAA